MIYHVSLPATDPQFAAETLARILEGEAMAFPVVPGAWMAWSGDGLTEIEVTQRGSGYGRGEPGREPAWRKTQDDGALSGWHLAIGTTLPAEEVVRISRDAGWPAQVCDRKGFFEVTEVWIDDLSMVEVLDPTMQAAYRASFTPDKWRAVLAQMPAGFAAGADVQA